MKLAHHRGPELLIRRILVADIDPLANRRAALLLTSCRRSEVRSIVGPI
jgi:hypothetical protein